MSDQIGGLIRAGAVAGSGAVGDVKPKKNDGWKNTTIDFSKAKEKTVEGKGYGGAVYGSRKLPEPETILMTGVYEKYIGDDPDGNPIIEKIPLKVGDKLWVEPTSMGSREASFVEITSVKHKPGEEFPSIEYKNVPSLDTKS